MKEIKEWFSDLSFSIIYVLALILIFIYKLKTGENIMSDFGFLKGLFGEDPANGAPETIKAVVTIIPFNMN